MVSRGQVSSDDDGHVQLRASLAFVEVEAFVAAGQGGVGVV